MELKIFLELAFQLLLVAVLSRDRASVLTSALFGIVIYYLAAKWGDIYLFDKAMDIYSKEGIGEFLGAGITLLAMFALSLYSDEDDLAEWGVYFIFTNIMFFKNMIPYVLVIPYLAVLGYAGMEYKAVEKLSETDKL